MKIVRICFRVLWKMVLVLVILISAFCLYFTVVTRIHEPEIGDRSIQMQSVNKISSNFKTSGNNWLRKSNSGLWELYLEGNGFERGVMNGKLTQDLAEFQETVFVSQIHKLVPSDKVLKWLLYFVTYFNRNLTEHVSEEYKNEIYGVSLYASDKFDYIAPKYSRILNYHSAHDIGHAIQDKNMNVGCTSFAVWNNKTKDGKLLIGRNFDFFSGEQFAENKIICFTKPSTGYKFMYVTWAGFTGVVSGMNDNGLTVTINAAKSEIPKSAATPISLLAKEILQYAGNISEAYAIAVSRQTFVSESILIGSASDKKAVIIEKTPDKTNLYSERGDQLICSNHFKSKAFAHDYINAKNRVESSSLYRQIRMEQLLSHVNSFTPEKVATVLRDQKGLNDHAIGFTNEKGINQLIAHHSIIFKPEDLLVWVSTSPYQLGEYVCYDLKKVFDEAPTLPGNKEIYESGLMITADPFLRSNDYQNVLMYRELSDYINYCTKNQYILKVSETHLKALESSNPEFYDTYRILGDYQLKNKNKSLALTYYKRALTKEIATKPEADKIREHIKLLNQPAN